MMQRRVLPGPSPSIRVDVGRRGRDGPEDGNSYDGPAAGDGRGRGWEGQPGRRHLHAAATRTGGVWRRGIGGSARPERQRVQAAWGGVWPVVGLSRSGGSCRRRVEHGVAVGAG